MIRLTNYEMNWNLRMKVLGTKISDTIALYIPTQWTVSKPAGRVMYFRISR